MIVTTSTMTIADYCDELQSQKIIVNPDYQRSNKVWPAAARSYLIETILLGYPVPKFSLYSKTDLKTRRTIKEIIDGQQRSKAILDFYLDNLRITGKGPFSGKRLKNLDTDDQQKFFEYALSVDIFVGTTEPEIREVFRRINSYTVPLNPQEKRHAVYQGPFKWWVVNFTKEYAQTLKLLGVFSEPQLSRMNDGILVSDFANALLNGIQTTKEKQLDELYYSRDERFVEESDLNARLESAVNWIVEMLPLHRTVLMKPYNLLTLLLAYTQTQKPAEKLTEVLGVGLSFVGDEYAVANLLELAEAVREIDSSVLEDDDEENPDGDDTGSRAAAYRSEDDLTEFVRACSGATNTGENRLTRMKFMYRALTHPNLR